MATTTPNFGWTVPTSTDLVKDGATAIETLGDGIDASFVDLKGGTTGQVLAKASGTDLDFSWVAQDDSNAIQNAIVDAKGDLIGATAADTPSRLAVGTNGQVLTADSAAATGLKWATPVSTPTFVGCTAYKITTAQSLANSAETAVTYNTEEFDTDGFHSTSTNTSRFTIPAGKAGKYFIMATASTANAGGIRQISILKNGTTPVNRLLLTAVSGFETQLNTSCVVDLAVSDYVECAIFQNSGGAINAVANQESQRFSLVYIGA
jgi:hypothetical protein